MKKLVALAAALSVVAAVPTFAADPPYKIPPGQYCKGMSKKKIPGQKKTPFAQCVTAMAKIEKGSSPTSACSSIKKGVKGRAAKKTAQAQFKKCVAAGNKKKSDLAAGNAA